MNARTMGVFAVVVSLCGGLAACDAFYDDDCACTLEYRYNLCITVNGSDSLPPGIGLLREREGGERDSLDFGMRCFGEWRGVQRVLLFEDGVVADSTGWFETRTVDCCHAEAKTVDFRIR